MLNKSLEQIIREVFTFLNYKNVFYLEDSSIFGNKHEENLYTVETFFFNDTVHSFCSYLSSYVFDIKALINNIELAPMVKINSIFLSASSSSLNRLAFWVSGCLLFAIILFVLCFIFLGKPKKMEPEKLAPYECGFAPFEDTYLRFDIRFYLVAILFIIFDLEVVYLFPWSLIFKSYIKTNVIGLDSNFIDSMVNSNFFINLDTFIFGNLFYSENLIVMDSIFLSLDNLINLVPFISMYVFLVILTVGFVYEWKRGALDWK